MVIREKDEIVIESGEDGDAPQKMFSCQAENTEAKGW